MKILLVAGRQRGLNFMESGQMAVIMMFSMVLHIKGPFRLRLLQYEPKGVEISSPSPLNVPILYLIIPSFSKQRFRIMIGSFISRWISSWQTAYTIVSQLILQLSFINFCEQRMPELRLQIAVITASFDWNWRQLQRPGLQPFPMPRIGGVFLQSQQRISFIKASLSPTTTMRSSSFKFFQLASIRTTSLNSCPKGSSENIRTQSPSVKNLLQIVFMISKELF